MVIKNIEQNVRENIEKRVHQNTNETYSSASSNTSSQNKLKKIRDFSLISLLAIGLNGNFNSKNSFFRPVSNGFNNLEYAIKSNIDQRIAQNTSSFTLAETSFFRNQYDDFEVLTQKIESYLDRFPIDKLPYDERISAEAIASAAIKYDIPFEFILAVGQLESRFLTDPKARRGSQTKSLFSVGLYDDGRNIRTYDNVNSSVDDFAKLIRNNYLGDNKNIDDLLDDFVNLEGNRYASNINYENQIRKQMEFIKRYIASNS